MTPDGCLTRASERPRLLAVGPVSADWLIAYQAGRIPEERIVDGHVLAANRDFGADVEARIVRRGRRTA